MKKRIIDLTYPDGIAICEDNFRINCRACPINELCSLPFGLFLKLDQKYLEKEVEVPELPNDPRYDKLRELGFGVEKEPCGPGNVISEEYESEFDKVNDL